MSSQRFGGMRLAALEAVFRMAYVRGWNLRHAKLSAELTGRERPRGMALFKATLESGEKISLRLELGIPADSGWEVLRITLLECPPQETRSPEELLKKARAEYWYGFTPIHVGAESMRDCWDWYCSQYFISVDELRLVDEKKGNESCSTSVWNYSN